MSIPRSLKFIITAMTVYAVGFGTVLLLILCGVLVPWIVALILYSVIVFLMLTGLILIRWD